MGWNYLIYTDTDYSHWMLRLRNTKNDANARGILVNTTFAGATGRVFEAQVQGGSQLYVDGSPTNPIYAKVGGVLMNVQRKLQSNLVAGDYVLVGV